MIKSIKIILLALMMAAINSVVFAQTGTIVHVVNNLARVGVFVTIPTTGIEPTVGPVNGQSQSSFGPYFLNKRGLFTAFDARYTHVGFGKCKNQDNLIGSDVTVIISEEKWINKNIEIICSVKAGTP